jgi:hypothetical protein
MRLLDYAANVFSQNGEDGILARVLDLLPDTDGWCVEFGAWDGQHLSNTCNLIQERDYAGVLIEADRKKYFELSERYADNPKITALNRFVGFGCDDNLDCLLANTPVPRDFDLLSIDIDGNDYHVWGALSRYTPKVVCIEYNCTIATEVDFVQAADRRVNQGASLAALTRLGRHKGYDLVCVSSTNAMFVRSCHFHLFGILDNSPRALREDLSAITHLFCGYDGTLFTVGREFLPHHRGVRIRRRLRQLPTMFRTYPQNFGPVRRLLYKGYWRGARLLGRG